MNTLYVILLTEVGIYKGKSNIQEKIKKTHDLDQGKKVTKISTKKTSNFKILPFFFYKFPPLGYRSNKFSDRSLEV